MNASKGRCLLFHFGPAISSYRRGSPFRGGALLFKTISAAVYGIDAELVEVEVDLAPRSGDSQHETIVTMVGLPDLAVRESRERIRSAITNCGFFFPVYKTTINLAPRSEEHTSELQSPY